MPRKGPCPIFRRRSRTPSPGLRVLPEAPGLQGFPVMKTLLLLLALMSPLQSQAFFWDRPEFKEADNVANLPGKEIKDRRSEKYRIVEFDLYRKILRGFDEKTMTEGSAADAVFARMTRAPMYAYTSNETGNILAPLPIEVYFKFADDFGAICLRRNYKGLFPVKFHTRCMSILPSNGFE